MTKEEIIGLFEYFLRDMGCFTKYKKCLEKNYKRCFDKYAIVPREFITSAFIWCNSLNKGDDDCNYWSGIHEQWLEVLEERRV